MAWSKRFRRNAADVEADTAETWALLNQRNLLAFVRRIEGGGVAAWTGAQD